MGCVQFPRGSDIHSRGRCGDRREGRGQVGQDGMVWFGIRWETEERVLGKEGSMG